MKNLSVQERSAIIEDIANAMLMQKKEGSILHRKFLNLIKECIESASVAEVEVVDSGYDYSTFGRASHVKVNKNQFETIRDFLDYPTGNSRPTFCSGSGMVAETWEDYVSVEWSEIITNYYNAIPQYRDIISSSFWIDYQGNALTEEDEISDDLHNELCDYLIDIELISAWEDSPLP